VSAAANTPGHHRIPTSRSPRTSPATRCRSVPVGALTASAYRFRARPVGPPDGRDVVHDVRGRLPRRAAEHVEPHRAAARRRLRAGQPGLALRQGSLRLRVGALRRARARADGAQERRAGRGVVARRRSTPPRRAARRARRTTVPSRFGVLGGARGTNEDAYVWARLAKGVLGTDNVDAQLGDGLPAEVVLGLPLATIADIDRARGVVPRRARPPEELPVLHLRVRRAAVSTVSRSRARPARRPGSRGERHRSAAHAPGEGRRDGGAFARALAGDGTASGSRLRSSCAVSALDAATPTSSWCRPGQSVRSPPDAVVAAAARSRASWTVKFLSSLRRGKRPGAARHGLAPVSARSRRDRQVRAGSTRPACSRRRSQADPTRSYVGTDLTLTSRTVCWSRARSIAVRFVIAVGAFASTFRNARRVPATSVWGERRAAPRTSRVA
jgi:NADH-quinone oxidoreductase subunit G